MIGKATAAVVVLFIVFGIVGYRLQSDGGMLILVAAAILTFFGFLGFLGWFANRHADLAATEGPTYVQSKRLDIRSKTISNPQNTQLGPDPQNPTMLGPPADE